MFFKLLDFIEELHLKGYSFQEYLKQKGKCNSFKHHQFPDTRNINKLKHVKTKNIGINR